MCSAATFSRSALQFHTPEFKAHREIVSAVQEAKALLKKLAEELFEDLVE
jgi:hypothetical protein